MGKPDPLFSSDGSYSNTIYDVLKDFIFFLWGVIIFSADFFFAAGDLLDGIFKFISPPPRPKSHSFVTRVWLLRGLWHSRAHGGRHEITADLGPLAAPQLARLTSPKNAHCTFAC